MTPTPAPRPHDLLWLADPAALCPDTPLPDWAGADWLARAPLVVRRAPAGADGRLPVGLRGRERAQRHATHAPPHAVARVLTPETLAQQAPWRDTSITLSPAIAALRTLAPQLDAIGLPWGPSGGVGFALASGLPVLRPDSDLDLLLRAATPLTPPQRAALRALQGRVACRLDIQIDTGHGGFALNEWLAEAPRLLLKTDHGPRLVRDPWQDPAPQGATP
nr:malonate decarboxylase holo-ACP synthase [uncultured Pseudogulbenkiania sp.]